jgi:hypothetical protein
MMARVLPKGKKDLKRLASIHDFNKARDGAQEVCGYALNESELRKMIAFRKSSQEKRFLANTVRIQHALQNATEPELSRVAGALLKDLDFLYDSRPKKSFFHKRVSNKGGSAG